MASRDCDLEKTGLLYREDGMTEVCAILSRESGKYLVVTGSTIDSYSAQDLFGEIVPHFQEVPFQSGNEARLSAAMGVDASTLQDVLCDIQDEIESGEGREVVA